MKRNLMIVVLVLVVGVVLAACGGGSEPTPTPAPAQGASAQEVLSAINVQMHDIYYGPDNNNVEKPPVWTVKAGDQVNINMDNVGALEHSWAILKQGAEMPMPYDPATNADLLLYDSGNLQPKQQKADSFTAPTEAGEYIVFCTVAGHYPVMQGRLVVE